MNNKQILGTFGLLFGAVSWGLIWYPYRIMQDAGVSGVASSFYTYLTAAIIAAILFAKHWRGLNALPKDVFLLAFVAGWTNLSYVLAVINAEVMRVMLLFYLSPLWTLILAYFWLKEPVGLKGLGVIATSLLGAFIMLWSPDSLPIPQNWAEWLALSSGIGFALTNVLARRTVNLTVRAKSMSIWIGVIAMSAFVAVFQDAPFPTPNVFTIYNWIVITLIALLLIAATVFVQYGITQIPVTRASVLFMFELVVAAIASYYLVNEKMELHEWIGGALIVFASIYAASLE